MKKWAIAGILYVTVVILGFQDYDKWIAKDKGYLEFRNIQLTIR